MIYGPAFYKLLDIPESVAEPTAYHLLRLDPRLTTPAVVDSALKARKVSLRQNIPGPQFIPVISLIERELDKAADILRDDDKRRRYNESLQRQVRQEKQKRTQLNRQELVQACRKVVRSMVAIDGSLPDSRREALAGRLAELGLPGDQVQYVVDNIPRPARSRQNVSPEQRKQDLDEAVRFFAAAVDLEVDRGVLIEADELKLTRMAERVGIAEDQARKLIDERLSALGASRGVPEEATHVAQFKVQLLAMYPEGQATVADRKRLLSLAASEGLLLGQAAKILDEYFGSMTLAEQQDVQAEAAKRRKRRRHAAGPAPEGMAAPRSPDQPALPAWLSTGEVQPPPPPLKPRSVPSVIGRILKSPRFIMFAILGIVAWTVAGVLIFSRGSCLPHDLAPGPVGGPGGGGPAQAGGGRPVELDGGPVPELLIEAFNGLNSPGRVAKLMTEAPPAKADEALRAAAKLLLISGTGRGQVLAEGSFRAVLGSPPASGRVQDAAVAALLASLRGRLEEGSPSRRADLQPAVSLLASTIFLRRSPGFPVTDAAQVSVFARRCERAWSTSRDARADDPIHDPERLARAIVDGGSLSVYAKGADEPRVTVVAAALGEMAAAGGDSIEGREAMTQLLRHAVTTSTSVPGQTAKRAAQLALCDVIEKTEDVQVALRARKALWLALALGSRDPMKTTPLDLPERRREVAVAIRGAISTGRRIVGPAGGGATTRAAPGTMPAPLPAGSVARRVRAQWSDGTGAPELLTDLAATALACADRVGKFTTKSDALSVELLDVLKEADASLRMARLTRAVRLAEPAGAAAPHRAAALGKDVADRYRRDLRSMVPGRRYRAIDELRALDTEEASSILIERLSGLVKSTGPDLVMVNWILKALRGMSDRTIAGKLAELIRPARSNYTAHRIVATLTAGSGLTGNVMQIQQYFLPPTHSLMDRREVAERWQIRAKSCAWGPKPAGGDNKAAPGVAGGGWQPEARVEKLLAAFVRYTQLTGQLLRSHKAASGASGGEAAPAPDVEAAVKQIGGPVTETDMLAATALLVERLTVLAREHAAGQQYAVKLDMIDLRSQSRDLACETALQKASVRLETAGRVLEVIAMETAPSAQRTQQIEALGRARSEALAGTRDVLAELRENCYHNLVLLELLPAKGP